MKTLPKFKARRPEEVEAFITRVLTHSDEPDFSYFQRLETFPDGYYRAVFDVAYFRQTSTPTKSQWNNLKKKMKRHDRRVFVLKECGWQPDKQVGYVDFGFFAH